MPDPDWFASCKPKLRPLPLLSNYLIYSSYSISEIKGHRIELVLNHQNPSSEEDHESDFFEDETLGAPLSVSSESALNDLRWHRLIVEQFRGEIRLSVDQMNSIQSLARRFPLPFETRFAIGDEM